MVFDEKNSKEDLPAAGVSRTPETSQTGSRIRISAKENPKYFGAKVPEVVLKERVASAQRRRKGRRAPAANSMPGATQTGNFNELKLFLQVLLIVALLWALWLGYRKWGERFRQSPAGRPKGVPALATNSVAEAVAAPTSFAPDQYVQPPLGATNELSVPEICWCVRENIRLEAMREIIDSASGIAAYDQAVDDYNNRCGSYYYFKGDQAVAEGLVEPYRSQIIGEAVLEVREWRRQQAQEFADATAAAADDKTEMLGESTGIFIEAGEAVVEHRATVSPPVNATGEASVILPDKIDAPLVAQESQAQQKERVPAATQSAAKTLPPRGSIRAELTLRHRPLSPIAQTVVPITIQTLHTKYFTRGSHQSEVFAIQGTPEAVASFAGSGYEAWRYGQSLVKIDIKERRVVSWDNKGDLQVRYLPGINVGDAPFFTRGTHQNDVLRVQGTPDGIEVLAASGYEIWRYGKSCVRLDVAKRRVSGWDNFGDLKVQYSAHCKPCAHDSFTRGSSQDDVLCVQGTPDGITSYRDFGYELWRYGTGSVRISLASQSVEGWENGEVLKVICLPGKKVTNQPAFGRNSHEDDVLRLQGTPTAIRRYSDHEVWRYGKSSVSISLKTRRVIVWVNSGGNLKARQ